MWPINNLEENNFIKFLQSKIVVEVYLANGYLLMSISNFEISNFGLSIIFVQISVLLLKLIVTEGAKVICLRWRTQIETHKRFLKLQLN